MQLCQMTAPFSLQTVSPNSKIRKRLTTHKILLNELQHHCSLHGTVLVCTAVTSGDKKHDKHWFKGYQSHRNIVLWTSLEIMQVPVNTTATLFHC